MNNIINLTQHISIEAQREDGVFEVDESKRTLIKTLLTFDLPPKAEEIEERAESLAAIAAAEGATAAMIGGAPYLMGALETSLKAAGIKPLYSFTRRETVEQAREGEVVKTSVFKHVGWVEV